MKIYTRTKAQLTTRKGEKTMKDIMKRMRTWVSLFLTVALSFSLCACSHSGDAGKSQSTTGSEINQMQNADELPVVRVATLTNISGTLFHYITENKYDIEEGVKIELSGYESGALINEALGAGLWDMAGFGGAGITSVAKFDCLPIFPYQDVSAGQEFVVRPDSDILTEQGYNPDFPNVYGSPETVRGKTILLTMGTGNHMECLEWLKAIGLTANDVTIVHMEFAQAWEAFKNGEGDICEVSYPFTQEAYDEGYKSVTTMADLDLIYANYFYATREFYESQPDALVGVCKAMLHAMEDLQDVDKATQNTIEWYGLNGVYDTEEQMRVTTENAPFLTKAQLTDEGFDLFASFKAQGDMMFGIGPLASG